MSSRALLVVRRFLLAAAFVGASAFAVAACKQQVGDRCQFNDDCDTGLVCNQATQQCASANSNGAIDASVPDIIDVGPELDAPVDAPDDADKPET